MGLRSTVDISQAVWLVLYNKTSYPILVSSFCLQNKNETAENQTWSPACNKGNLEQGRKWEAYCDRSLGVSW